MKVLRDLKWPVWTQFSILCCKWIRYIYVHVFILLEKNDFWCHPSLIYFLLYMTRQHGHLIKILEWQPHLLSSLFVWWYMAHITCKNPHLISKRLGASSTAVKGYKVVSKMFNSEKLFVNTFVFVCVCVSCSDHISQQGNIGLDCNNAMFSLMQRKNNRTGDLTPRIVDRTTKN